MQIDYEHFDELIRIHANIEIGTISVLISLTSPAVQQDNGEYRAEEFLSRSNCLKALNTMESVRWFQVRTRLNQTLVIFSLLSRIMSVNVLMLCH